jgi:hypothetical protein
MTKRDAITTQAIASLCGLTNQIKANSKHNSHNCLVDCYLGNSQIIKYQWRKLAHAFFWQKSSLAASCALVYLFL